jgi:hypothetical protein
VSELLQSQLLQPLNVTPIQPRQGAGSLFLLSAEGPSTLSTNEFNPLFNRNRLTGQLQGLGGNQDTWRGTGIAAGITTAPGQRRRRLLGDRLLPPTTSRRKVAMGFAVPAGPATSCRREAARTALDNET